MNPLLRNIIAAVLGYVVMFAVAFGLFSLMWAVLGADGSFAPGSWEVSGAWIASSIALGVMVSVAGGFACSKMAASPQGVAILVGLVIVFGILAAMPDAQVASTVRPEGVSMFDSMSGAVMPMWLTLLNPVIGVFAVMYGARLERGRGDA